MDNQLPEAPAAEHLSIAGVLQDLERASKKLEDAVKNGPRTGDYYRACGHLHGTVEGCMYRLRLLQEVQQ